MAQNRCRSGAETAAVICDMWDQHWCRAATACVAEMLFQSHAGALELLPALPSAWPLRVFHRCTPFELKQPAPALLEFPTLPGESFISSRLVS